MIFANIGGCPCHHLANLSKPELKVENCKVQILGNCRLEINIFCAVEKGS
jgi:hypothetical protein